MLVRMVQRSRELLEHVDRVAQVHRLAEAVGKRPALDQLQDQVGDAVLAAEVEDLEDVRMLQPRDRAGFLLEALSVVGVVGEEVGQHLDRDVAVQRRVVGAVDRGHAAAADALQHPVGAEGVSLLQLHRSSPMRTSRPSSGGAAASAIVQSSSAPMASRRAMKPSPARA